MKIYTADFCYGFHAGWGVLFDAEPGDKTDLLVAYSTKYTPPTSRHHVNYGKWTCLSIEQLYGQEPRPLKMSEGENPINVDVPAQYGLFAVFFRGFGSGGYSGGVYRVCHTVEQNCIAVTGSGWLSDDEANNNDLLRELLARANEGGVRL